MSYFELLDQAPILLKAWFLNLLGSYGVPAWLLVAISAVIIIGTIIGVFLTLFALTSVMERKILARVQNRYGPNRVGPCGLFQPVADGIKMITKEDLVPRSADKIVHFLAPVVMMVPALMVLAIKYSVMGAMRAIAQMVSYELPLIISAVVVAMVTGSLGPSAIVAAQGNFSFGFIPGWYVFTPWGFVACLLFYIAALAEANRSPFDLPEGESELVAGHLTEYSGFKYATFFMAEYVGMFAICGLLVTLFLGGWHAPLPFLEIVPSWCWFFGKIAFIAFTMIWVRATLPRMRIDHLMTFAWKFMLPMSFAAFVAAACWHFAGRGLIGWAVSAVIVAIPYFLLGNNFTAKFAVTNRRYQFSE